MGLGGADGMGEDFKVIGLGEGQATKVWDHFLWGNWPLKTACKYFNFAIGGGMKYVKWLKNGAGKDLYFMRLFLHISFLVKILLFKLKNHYIQYTWFSIMKKQNKNQNVKVEKMVIFVKTSDH